MKKYYYLSVAALALAGCTSDEYFDNPSEKEAQQEHMAAIDFGSNTAKQTRADNHVKGDAAELLGNNFVVEGVMSDGTIASQVEAFDHYNVNYKASTANTTQSNTADWEYVGQTIHPLTAASAQTIKYWNYDTKQYDFVAFSYGKAAKTNVAADGPVLSEIDYSKLGAAVSTGTPVYTVTGSAADLAKTYIADLLTVYNRDGADEYGTTTVTPVFRSMGTKVRIAFYETVPGYSVKNVKFYSEAWDGKTATTAEGVETGTLFATNTVFPSASSKGTMSVYFPTVGWANSGKATGATAYPDYNQAHISFAAGTESGDALVTTKTFGTLDYKTAAEGSETAGTIYLGRASSEATYAGASADNYYQVVLPLGSSDNLQIRVEYDLIPTDGGAGTIHVRDARAVIPAKYADWKPNYAYTYIFKISDQTNGWTGTRPVHNPDYDPTDPDSPEFIEEPVEGLTPITFDAVVVDTEDGIQETITTVATPSITTYQLGEIVTTGSEYQAGDIYASVMNGETAVDLSALTAPAGVAVYEATAADTDIITEAIVQEQLNGTKHDTGITLTSCGYELVAEVPAVDGNTLAVSACKFTAASGKIYVFMYTDGSKNYVKVIRIQ